MNDFIIWIIIIAFYAPLHYSLPVIILFITGNESEQVRSRLIRRALLDSTLSMILAFVCAVILVQMDQMIWAMLALLVSMPLPFVRIFQHRQEMNTDQ
jgi:fatty acid desaturase